MTYKKFTKAELDDIIQNPRSIAKEPYKLFISYVFNSMYDNMLFSIDYEDEEEQQCLWDMSIPAKDFYEYLDECVNDFKNAVQNRLGIDFGGEHYTIRNASDIDYIKLKNIFEFYDNEGNITITVDGVNDVSNPVATKDEISSNKVIAQRIWYVGNKMDDGWDKLTAMEAAIYCWIVYARAKNRIIESNAGFFYAWYRKYKNYMEMPFSEVSWCLEDGLVAPKSPYSFSASKIETYNKSHHEHSILDTVDIQAASEYWLN